MRGHYTAEDIVAAIAREKPAVVFAPHVETSTGVMFPDDELEAIAAAAHAVGALFVLDCVASGTAWVDMKATGVDVVISAPQKVRRRGECEFQSGINALGVFETAPLVSTP